jgi:hypothetical protein
MKFLKDLIRKSGIFLDNEGIVCTGNQQDAVDTILHQIAVGLVFGAIFQLVTASRR